MADRRAPALLGRWRRGGRLLWRCLGLRATPKRVGTSGAISARRAGDEGLLGLEGPKATSTRTAVATDRLCRLLRGQSGGRRGLRGRRRRLGLLLACLLNFLQLELGHTRDPVRLAQVDDVLCCATARARSTPAQKRHSSFPRPVPDTSFLRHIPFPFAPLPATVPPTMSRKRMREGSLGSSQSCSMRRM